MSASQAASETYCPNAKCPDLRRGISYSLRRMRVLVVRAWIGNILRRLPVQVADQLVRRWRYRHRTLEDDGFSFELLVVDLFVGIIVGPNSRAFQRDTGEQASSAGIAQHFRAQRHVGRCIGGATLGTRG